MTVFVLRQSQVIDSAEEKAKKPRPFNGEKRESSHKEEHVSPYIIICVCITFVFLSGWWKAAILIRHIQVHMTQNLLWSENTLNPQGNMNKDLLFSELRKLDGIIIVNEDRCNLTNLIHVSQKWSKENICNRSAACSMVHHTPPDQ